MCSCKIFVIICSIQALLNHYWLEHLNLVIQQVRDKVEWIAHSVLYVNKKGNSYANYIYPNNQLMHLNPGDALFAIQFKPDDGFSVPHF